MFFAGQEYLNGMAAAANFAWVNRSSMTFLARQAFAKMFEMAPDDLDMHVIYDVSHNIAKVEEHFVNGRPKTLLGMVSNKKLISANSYKKYYSKLDIELFKSYCVLFNSLGS